MGRKQPVYYLSRFPPCAAVLLILTSLSYPAAAQQRYAAIFRDGTRALSDRLPVWPLEGEADIFADRPLWDAANPVRLMVDRDTQPTLVGPYLELANGDILPGRIVGHRPEAADRPGRFAVALEGWLQAGEANTIDVRATAVARIVGGKQGILSPDSLGVLLADGRKLVPRSLRFTSTGIRLLTEHGITDAPFADLADVVLSGVDRTTAALVDSLLAGQGYSKRIYRLTTREGASLTASRVYRQTETDSRRGRDRMRRPQVPRIFYLVRPSWSFDTMQVPEESLCQCSVRLPEEIPLSLLSAKTLVEKSLLGIRYPWRRNQAARGGTLSSGDLVSDLGLGTHSHSELAFDLPEGAQEFSTWVGLDRNVGIGGCVVCKVYLEQVDGPPLWQSDFLRGGMEPIRVGPLDIQDAKRLVLVTEFGHENRPADADPLDIRDEVVWLSPTVRTELAIGRRPD